VGGLLVFDLGFFKFLWDCKLDCVKGQK
jgi:hypothetical protein